MKYAIKHNQPEFYLQKNRWNFSSILNENTVYDDNEVVSRLMELEDFDRETMKKISGSVRIVPVRLIQNPMWEEVDDSEGK